MEKLEHRLALKNSNPSANSVLPTTDPVMPFHLVKSPLEYNFTVVLELDEQEGADFMVKPETYLDVIKSAKKLFPACGLSGSGEYSRIWAAVKWAG